MPERDLHELALLLHGETGVSYDDARRLLESEDPIIRRQVNSVIDSVRSRSDFEAVMARHRARFGQSRALV
jgi:hypothetical protein